ncbi:glutamate-5-semialdehyde dehydrogenase [Abyssisolibacter fermentans]|uniref:glutamate-5-semialdehyde dehydrogenase n=1 Tax=Abyssisolibacter fermentans TaxID=1766203 RepID=UPI0008372937|nr:glutamate-5-semialdehyde dehydrogenase [Abyssisolibacter fermentans]
MNIRDYVVDKAKLAKEASRKMNTISEAVKNEALKAMANALIDNIDLILTANAKDIENGKQKGLSKYMLDRLLLNDERINQMADGIRIVASLKDPIGEAVKMWRTQNNLQIGQIRVPLGVIGMIFESRPNVTVDAAALCIKAGNSVILRGGSEAINSNIALANIIKEAARENGLPNGCIQFIDITDREAVNEMMRLNKYIDVLIPRGGKGLINAVVNNATVPVIETGTGNCHVFIDESADTEMAHDIVINGKTQRPAVCNAIETILIHKNIASKVLPKIAESLTSHGVEIRGCKKTEEIIPDIKPANKEDWATEYLDFIVAIKVVESIDEAIEHIYKYGTNHSEVIVTNDYNNSQKFLREIDAAAVYVNASSRFTDGSQFGFGAEIGISTQKLHARGPMGLKELTTTKYIIYGEGQIRG